jgi:hypothetical protein
MKRSSILTLLLLSALLPSPCRAEDPPVFVLAFGSPGTGDGQLNNPNGIGVDALGFVYVADTGNLRIEKFSPTGSYVAQWDGSGTAAGRFVGPSDVAISSNGTIYIADGGTLDVFGPDLTFQQQWTGNFSGFLAFDPSEQYLYVNVGIVIYKYRVSDGMLVNFWQYANSFPGFGLGTGPSGTLYAISDGYVQTFSPDGVFLGHWQPANSPWALTVDADENLFVTTGGEELQKYTKGGALLSRAPTTGVTLRDVALDRAHSIYIASQGTNQVLKFAYPPVPVLKRSWGQLQRHYR